MDTPIASAESEPTGTLLAGSAVSVIEDNTQGIVKNFLQDGGTAIMTAVKMCLMPVPVKYLGDICVSMIMT